MIGLISGSINFKKCVYLIKFIKNTILKNNLSFSGFTLHKVVKKTTLCRVKNNIEIKLYRKL